MIRAAAAKVTPPSGARTSRRPSAAFRWLFIPSLLGAVFAAIPERQREGLRFNIYERRDRAYATIEVSRFGAFPAGAGPIARLRDGTSRLAIGRLPAGNAPKPADFYRRIGAVGRAFIKY